MEIGGDGFFSCFFLGKKATKSPVAAMLPPHMPDAGPLPRQPTALLQVNVGI